MQKKRTSLTSLAGIVLIVFIWALAWFVLRQDKNELIYNFDTANYQAMQSLAEKCKTDVTRENAPNLKQILNQSINQHQFAFARVFGKNGTMLAQAGSSWLVVDVKEIRTSISSIPRDNSESVIILSDDNLKRFEVGQLAVGVPMNNLFASLLQTKHRNMAIFLVTALFSLGIVFTWWIKPVTDRRLEQSRKEALEKIRDSHLIPDSTSDSFAV